MRLAAWRAAVRTVRLLRRRRKGRALVNGAGMAYLPPGFDGAALLDDLDAAGSEYWLAGEGASFGVANADINAFDHVMNAIRRAHSVVDDTVSKRPNVGAALRAGLAASGGAIAPRLGDAGAFQSLDMPVKIAKLDVSVRLDSIRHELAALVAGAKAGRELLEKGAGLTPILDADARNGLGTPYGHLVGSALPQAFERHTGRGCALWERDGATSGGVALINAALAYLGLGSASAAALVKAAQRQREAEAEEEGRQAGAGTSRGIVLSYRGTGGRITRRDLMPPEAAELYLRLVKQPDREVAYIDPEGELMTEVDKLVTAASATHGHTT